MFVILHIFLLKFPFEIVSLALKGLGGLIQVHVYVKLQTLNLQEIDKSSEDLWPLGA